MQTCLCRNGVVLTPTQAPAYVPAIVRAGGIVCVVPGPTKREALRVMLRGPVSTQCPASVLRRHPEAVVYADVESASEV